MFLTAVSLFGTLISQLNEIVAKQTSQTKELDDNLETYLAVQPRSVICCHCKFGAIPKQFWPIRWFQLRSSMILTSQN